MKQRLLRLKGICKSFLQNQVLQNINFELNAGEFHALMGENGAGKSTLIKIIGGIHPPDSGTIEICGKTIKTPLTPKFSADLGIAIVHQELSVIDELSIAENLFLGRLPFKKFRLDYSYMYRESLHLLKQIGLETSPGTLLGHLRVSEKQLVEIAKALHRNARILILDEPTSSLTPKEADKLFAILANLQAQQKGIIYISHKIHEIWENACRVTVLRDGQVTRCGTIQSKMDECSAKKCEEGLSHSTIINAMVGREIHKRQPKMQIKSKLATILDVQNLSRKDNKIRNIDFSLYEREILGFFGIVGAGRTELMEALIGAAKSSGRLILDGKSFQSGSPYQALKNGMIMVSEDRRRTGLFPNFSIQNNAVLSRSVKEAACFGLAGLIQKKKEVTLCREYLQPLAIRCRNYEQNIVELSGGNQQKVIIGRCLGSVPRLLIFDEPTKGISIGSKEEIYTLIQKLNEKGIGLILVSSELPELLSITDRIVVMNDGAISGIVHTQDSSEEELLALAITPK